MVGIAQDCRYLELTESQRAYMFLTFKAQLACFVPVRRASTLDPLAALRCE